MLTLGPSILKGSTKVKLPGRQIPIAFKGDSNHWKQHNSAMEKRNKRMGIEIKVMLVPSATFQIITNTLCTVKAQWQYQDSKHVTSQHQ